MQDVGEFTESIEPLREILAHDPGNAEANYLLGAAFVRIRQSNSAIWRLGRAAESEKFAVPANMTLAELYFGVKDFDAALAAANKVLAQQPDHREALSLRYKANLEAKRREEALADLARLIELYPQDLEFSYARAITLGELGRFEESEAAHRQFAEAAKASNDPGLAARACAMYALAFRDYAEDLERAEQEMTSCLESYPGDGFVTREMVRIYDESDRDEEALALIRRTFEANPDDLSRRSALSGRLQSMGRNEEAEALLLEAVEQAGGMAPQLALAEFYRKQGDPGRALELMEEVFAVAGKPRNDEARFTYADILLAAGKTEAAEEIAAEIEDPVYKQLIDGRIALERGDAKTALGLLEAAVQQWPDNPAARYMAGLAALQVGDVDRAIAQLREAVRVDERGTDAAIALARIYFERGEYEDATKFARSYARKRGRDRPEGYVVGARALMKLGNIKEARSVIDRLEENVDAPLEAAVERAALEREVAGPAAALAVIDGSGLDLSDVANERALRSAVRDLLALGKNQEALARVRAAVAAEPDQARFRTLEGSLLAQSGQEEAASAAFAKARELDPKVAEALMNLASAVAGAGEYEGAAALFQEAARVEPENPSPAYTATQLLRGAGRNEEAMQRLREIVQRHPGAAEPRNDLAWMLAESGQELDLALQLAEEAARLDPRPPILDTLGFVHLKRGEHAAAVAAFQRALAIDPRAASVRYRLGLALAQSGDHQRARIAFEQALVTGSFEEEEEARSELARLDQLGTQ